MKITKKIFSVVCALGIATSMLCNVYAESVIVDDALSLELTDNMQTNNTVNIDIKTSYDTIKGMGLSLRVPKELKDYIDTWTFSTNASADLVYGAVFNDYDKAPNYSYMQLTITPKNLISFDIPDNDIIVTATITLKEGGIPASLSEATRTITLGSPLTASNRPGKQGATTITDNDEILYYIKTTETTFNDTTGKFNYMNFDVTAEDNYVVLPTAKPDDPVTATVVGYFTGDKEAEGDNLDTTDKAAAIVGTPVEKTDATSLVWTVTSVGDETQTFTQAVDVSGGATYKFGLVLRNITKDFIKTVSSVLQ